MAWGSLTLGFGIAILLSRSTWQAPTVGPPSDWLARLDAKVVRWVVPIAGIASVAFGIGLIARIPALVSWGKWLWAPILAIGAIFWMVRRMQWRSYNQRIDEDVERWVLTTGNDAFCPLHQRRQQQQQRGSEAGD